ncbi:hydantoinase/oxoprolinase N-terminal domain-containing protein [Arthrobacter sp. 24S4-2]|uniref:hydantoinase/oxoprolinase N-terminal domain-containing protein n=1 Tax=Arthrobacter sp. 24S4-2 TaxID=2575374 RepID=UPI001C306345|nr:hydantoinase/oxoprolinase family protein [Arthrobacter sp. 24S4-2]
MLDPTNDSPLRIGFDVGGTNTDAAVIDERNTILFAFKRPTTTDVSVGIRYALDAVVDALGDQTGRVSALMLGTTHATNAVVERRGLDRVGVIRLGRSAASAVPPLSGWPSALRKASIAGVVELDGAHLPDGHPIAPLDLDGLRRFLDRIAGTAATFAVAGVFSPSSPDQEREVADLIRNHLGPVPVSLSHEVGTLGLIERENATVLNAALHTTANGVVEALKTAVRERGLMVDTFLAQNDGSLMTGEYAKRFPVLTVGSGPSNSIRGAALLTGLDDAIVIDVGGTHHRSGRAGGRLRMGVGGRIGHWRRTDQLPDAGRHRTALRRRHHPPPTRALPRLGRMPHPRPGPQLRRRGASPHRCRCGRGPLDHTGTVPVWRCPPRPVFRCARPLR